MSLFFALWPEASAAAELARLAVDLAPALEGKPVPQEKIHLTLAFLGNPGGDAIERAIDVGDATAGDAFALEIDHVGAFRGARVAWAGVAAPPAALLGLHAALRSRLVAAELPVEERPYAPHLTLVRKIARALPRTALPGTIGWSVEGFALVESAPGTGRYATVATWDLR
jgi:2'-5' RNA ligase